MMITPGFEVQLYNSTGLESVSKQRDAIRLSNDSILCMFLDLRNVKENLRLTHTLKFQSKTTVQINVTVEAVDNITKWNEESLTLNIPDLNLTSGVGLRTERTTPTGPWLKGCQERVRLREMCVTGSSLLQGKRGFRPWEVGTTAAGIAVVILFVVFLLQCTGKLSVCTHGIYIRVRRTVE